MNCTFLDDALASVAAEEGEWRRHAAVGSLSLLATLLACFGEALARPLSASLGAVGAGVGVFVVTGSGGEAFGCEERLIASSVAALAGTLLALCVFRGGLFLLGAAAFGGVAHVVYEALVASGTVEEGGGLRFLGRSAYHYAAVAGGSAVGAVATCVQKTNFVRLVTSLLAGGCLVLATRLALSDGEWGDVSSYLPLLLLAGTGVGGFLAQKGWARRARRKRSKPRDTRDVHSLPPIRDEVRGR